MPEARANASPDATPKGSKKIVYLLGSAILAGVVFGGGGAALALQYLDVPAPPGKGSAAEHSKPAGVTPPARAIEAAPTAESLSPNEQLIVAERLSEAAGIVAKNAEKSKAELAAPAVQHIPALTGAEIQEKYGISRFIDKDANLLCYLADSSAASTRAPVTCVPLPTKLAQQQGN